MSLCSVHYSLIVPVVLDLYFVLKMVSVDEIHGYEEFVKYAEAIDPNGPPVVFYFSGEKLPSGESWCIDCVEGMYSLCLRKLKVKSIC